MGHISLVGKEFVEIRSNSCWEATSYFFFFDQVIFVFGRIIRDSIITKNINEEKNTSFKMIWNSLLFIRRHKMKVQSQITSIIRIGLLFRTRFLLNIIYEVCRHMVVFTLTIDINQNSRKSLLCRLFHCTRVRFNFPTEMKQHSKRGITFTGESCSLWFSLHLHSNIVPRELNTF